MSGQICFLDVVQRFAEALDTVPRVPQVLEFVNRALEGNHLSVDSAN